MAKVLLVGYIRELLEEPKDIFHAAGHHAAIAADQKAAYQAIERDTFDVAVLGFSVPEQERNEMARRLTQNNSGTRIVMMYFTSVQNTELADALVPTTASAQEVLRAVNHVLKTQKSSKTG
jgi:DNA-binding response OmpR family regulator